MDVIDKIEEWLDEEGCVSYAGLCRWARSQGDDVHRCVIDNIEHFDLYMEAMLEDALSPDED